VPEPDDTTLEVLMHGIDERRAAAYRQASANREGDSGGVAARFGLDTILRGFDLDEHVFDPAGYSLNGARDGSYFAIHVTPQRDASYVSFETNFDFRADPQRLVEDVVERFGPECFDVVAFVPGAGTLDLDIPGYRRRKRLQEPLSGYQVTFQHYYRPSSAKGRAASISPDGATGR
jgi:S-adenosylmethionine decarboxylase